MIRLTLNAHSEPEIHLFNKSTIFIGSDSSHVDLVLPGPDIQPIHLKIIEQKGIYSLINSANDPFVSINGHPFGKKILSSGDLIVIHQITLFFETLNSPVPETEEPKEKENHLSALLDNKIKEKDNEQSAPISSTENPYLSPFSFPFEQEIEAFNESELQKTPLDQYLNELETENREKEAPTPPAETNLSHLGHWNKKIDSKQEGTLPSSSILPEKKQSEWKKTASLKDDYLRDLDDDNQSGAHALFAHQKEPSHLYQAWKWILLFIFSLFAISGAIGSVIYFTVSDKAEAQETKAAQGVADVAMALMNAQLNHLKPHNHNWSDVDFLKSNLQTILPDSSSYASQIDPQGQFNCCPYSLRIYTSSDLSHFLLIAQPAPSLLNWLIPQSLIVVDSHLMELRILKDVRGLNRLLANSDPLDGANGKEITSLIKQEGLIRLATLASETGHLDFAPPKNLAWIQPGAENLIYNAPRYYRLSDHIIQKAIALSTSKGSSQEVAALKQDIETLSDLNHFVLYSNQGKKSAMLVRQGLMLFAPSDKLLFGYLLFNAQGKIHQVYLLKEEDELKESSLTGGLKEGELIASVEAAASNEMSKKNPENEAIDTNHPIYIQLQSLVVGRENELKPLAASLSNLVNQELLNPHAQFQVEFQNLSHIYLMANAKHKQAIKESLDHLYQQYENIPIHQFLAFIKALNLEQLIQQEDQKLTLVDENCQQNMELLLTYIENSKSMAELDNLVHMASLWLNFDYIKDPHELMKYQNLLRNQLLEQLERYLLSQKKHALVKADDKEILIQILNQERLIKPEERDFFLGEFDEIFALQGKQQEEKPVSEEKADKKPLMLN